MESPTKRFNIFLPEEIIVDEILSRLPVKSLLKFRCVCKSWLSFISSSQFIKNHLNKNSKYDYYAKHKTIISTKDSFTNNITYYAYPFNSILYEKSLSIKGISKIDIPTSAPINGVFASPIGSCNGLLCLFGRNKYTIFNPSLRRFRKLPILEIQVGLRYTHGFGYDEVSDDYKVIRLVSVNVSVSSGGVNVAADIYSLRNNCWRKINNPPKLCLSLTSGVLVSGKLHWVKSGGPNEFISFDLVTEKFGKMAHPKHGYSNGKYIHWTLVESHGCLYSFAYVPEKKKSCIDVWEMKEYGVEEQSWNKLGSIVINKWGLRPFYVTEKSDVLLQANNSVYLYNLKNSEKVRKLCSGEHPFIYFQAYIDSLVPPYLDGDFKDICSVY